MARATRTQKQSKKDVALPEEVAELAQRRPLLALDRVSDLTALEGWPVEAIAALVGSAPQDHPVSLWADSKNVSLWRIARSVAGPLRAPRDWANDLLVDFARVASRLDVGWPAENTDLLGAPFHVHHRHATAEQLAWVDPAGLSREELLLLGRHPRADARVAAGVLAELESRWHAGPDTSDEDLVRARRSLERAPEAVLLGDPPPALAPAVRALLSGEDDEVRATLERTTHEVVFHRLLHIAGLDARRRIEVLVRVATLGFGWQRGVALRRLCARSDAGLDDFTRAAHGVRGDDFADFIAEPRLPPQALRVLWERLPSYQHRVVRHPNAPRDLLEARSDFAFDAALESSRDEAWLAEVATRVRGTPAFFAITRNPRCPPELLAELSSHGVAAVRGDAAMHRRATPATLRALATDGDVGIRELVAMNRSAPADLLGDMAADESPVVRAWVAHHPSTPLALLESLATDPHSRVRAAAGSWVAAARLAEGLLTFDEVAASSRKVRREAAARTRLDAGVQAQLVEDRDVAVRKALAGSQGALRSILERLAADADPTVRCAVAEGASTPADLRAKLAKDPRRWIAAASRSSG